MRGAWDVAIGSVALCLIVSCVLALVGRYARGKVEGRCHESDVGFSLLADRNIETVDIVGFQEGESATKVTEA